MSFRAIVDVNLTLDYFKNVGILRQGYFAVQFAMYYKMGNTSKLYYPRGLRLSDQHSRSD